ncbi:MAG: ABC transporter substrate-binding protein [Candidatus Bathyarchaeia archaeon]
MALAKWNVYNKFPSNEGNRQDSAGYLIYVTPIIPLYWAGCYINAYAPDLRCWIESPGFSSNNFWTYNWITWTTPPLSPGWRFHIPSPLESLNPVTSTSRSSWQVLDLIIDSLIQINPFTHEHVLWAVKSWYPPEGYEPFIEPNVTHGMKVTLELRPGICWHDGVPVSASTIKYNLDFIKEIQPPRLSNVWKTYLRSIVQEPPNDKITIYINGTQTGFWPIYEYLKAALLVPPHIYCPYGPVDLNQDGVVTYNEVVEFKPWQTPHPWALNMTCLIGTGPWAFKGWNDTIRLVKYEHYFARIFLREDTNFDGIVDMTDIGMVLRAFTATPSHPKWNNGQFDVNCDKKVDMTDVGMVLRKFGKITLPCC